MHWNKIEEFSCILGFNSWFFVDRIGKGGALALYWRSSINCQIIDYLNNHITLEIVDDEKGSWQLTGYYGYPNGGRRRASWDFLRQLSQQSSRHWCIFGDFNDIMDASEKRGKTNRSNWLINGFRQAVMDFGLSDVPVEGYPFTWFMNLGTPRVVEERLDRVLANNAWFDLFPSAKLENLVAPASDHYPILLDRSPVVRPPRAQRSFRFENSWKLEPGFDDMLKDSWLLYNDHTIIHCLNKCAEDIRSWSREHCNKLKKDSDDCRKKLCLSRINNTGAYQVQLMSLHRQMAKLLMQEDAYWRQRAKTHWYKEGK